MTYYSLVPHPHFCIIVFSTHTPIFALSYFIKPSQTRFQSCLNLSRHSRADCLICHTWHPLRVCYDSGVVIVLSIHILYQKSISAYTIVMYPMKKKTIYYYVCNFIPNKFAWTASRKCRLRSYVSKCSSQLFKGLCSYPTKLTLGI